MDKLKYIVDSYGNFAIFSPTAIHANVARTMNGKPVGAGFITIEIMDGEYGGPIITCYGESVSLGIKSRHEVDAEAIFSKLYS